MFCPNCGTKNEDGAAFCGNCGASLTEAQAEMQEQQSAANQEAQEQQPETSEAQEALVQPQQVQEAPKAPKPRKPVSKKLIGAIAAGAAVIAAIVVFIVVGSSAGNYESIAKKYAEAVLSGDFAKAYGYMNLPESEFLSKDQLVIAMKEKGELKNFSVKVKEMSQAEKKAQELLESLGMGSTDDEGRETKKVVFEVTYTEEGSTSPSTQTLTVPMKKSDKKAMLFFSKWEVDSDSLICKECTVKAPKGSVVMVDGITLGDKHLDKDASEESQDVYKIDYMFRGTHQVKTTRDQFEDFEGTYHIDSSTGARMTCNKTSLKEDVLKQVGDEAAEAAKVLYESVIKKTDYDALSIKKPSDKEEAETLKKAWNDFKTRQVEKTGSGYNLTSIKWSKVTGSAMQYGSGGELGQGIKTTVTMEAEASLKSSTKDKSGKVNLVVNLYYRYQGGQWYIYNISMRVIS